MVDAGALLTNWHQKYPDAILLTASSIIDEIKNKPSIQRVDYLISIGILSTEDPQQYCIDKVQEAAIETGDISVLSSPDIDLLAIAYSMSHSGEDVVVVSTDFAVLNVARNLGLKIIDPKGKITHHTKWIMKCPACGNLSEDGKSVECEICGTRMKRRSASKKRL